MKRKLTKPKVTKRKVTTLRPSISVRAEWAMEQRGERQVKCLIASAGHLWMRDFYDNLPATVRRRLA